MDVGTITDITLEAGDLATVAGAGAFAMIVAQFAKRLLNLTTGVTRSTAMLAGLIVVVLVTVTTQDETSIVALLLAVVVGCQAGLSASALFDNAREGISHSTFPANTVADPLVGLAVEDGGELEGITEARVDDPEEVDAPDAENPPAE